MLHTAPGGVDAKRLLRCDVYAFPAVKQRAMKWYVLHLISFLMDNRDAVTVSDFIHVLRQDRWAMARRGTLRPWYGPYLFSF